MVFETKNFFLLVIFILLQSCSGGKIGNFLETSFKNIEEPKIKEDIKKNVKDQIVKKSGGNVDKNKNIEEPKIKEDIKKNVKDQIVNESGENVDKNKKIEEPKIKKDLKNNIKNNKVIKSMKKSKTNKKITEKNISFTKKKFQPQSYKIIFILKDVDPKDPTEDLRTILRNSDVNFEIEKIERFFDPKNKSIKIN